MDFLSKLNLKHFYCVSRIYHLIKTIKELRSKIKEGCDLRYLALKLLYLYEVVWNGCLSTCFSLLLLFSAL